MLNYTKDGQLKEMIDRGIVEVGDYTYGNPKVLSFDADNHLIIGKYCSIAEDVEILLGGEHRTDWVTTYPFPAEYDLPREDYRATKGEVVIGNDVWLCRGCKILSGVTIGDGAVIGAWAVVSKDVQPYTIVAGNPQRVIKKRFSDETIERLLQVKWWNWSVDKIKDNINILCSNNHELIK